MTVVRRRRTKRSPEQRRPPSWATLSEQSEAIKAVWYGDPSTGKTSAMAAAAHFGPVVFLNAEGGLKRAPLRRLGIPVEQISVVQARSFERIQSFIWDVRDRLDREPGSIVAVLVDSITEVEAQLLNLTVEEQLAKDENRDRFLIERDDYNRNASQMRKLIRDLRDLPCHVGFSALSRRDVDENDGTVVYRPALTPSVGSSLMGWTDIVCAVQPVITKGGRRIFSAYTQRYGKWMGKDRLNALPPRMAFPTFDRIIGYVEGTLDIESDPEGSTLRPIREKEKE